MAFRIKNPLPSEVDLGETHLENVFIKHYLPSASAEELKVYLLGIYCAQHNIDASVASLAKELEISEKKVLHALEHWENLHFIALSREEGELHVDFRSIRSQVFAGKSLVNSQQDAEKKLSNMVLHIKKSPITSTEYGFYAKFIKNCPNGMEILETVLILYYQDKKGNHFTEVRSLLEDILEAGYTDAEQVAIYANNYLDRHNFYKRVKLLISTKTTSTRAEQTMMNNWLDHYHMSETDIVKFVEKHSPNTNNPTIGFINKQIEEAHSQTDEYKARQTLCKKFKLEITGSRYAVNKTEQKIMSAWLDDLHLSEDEVLEKIAKHSPARRGATVEYIDQCIRGLAPTAPIRTKKRSKKRVEKFEDAELEALLKKRLEKNK